MSEKRGKKRPKSYYIKSANQKHRKGNVLEAGMRGFLVTCNNNQERHAVIEAYNILNEYADLLYDPEQPEQAEAQTEGTCTEGDKTNAPPLNTDTLCEDGKQSKDSGVNNDDDDEEEEDDDMEAALKREVTKLKCPESSQTPKRFQNVRTKAKGCIFISTTIENPVGLAYNIFQEIAQSGVQKSRYALRLLPIIATCRACPDAIIKCAEPVLGPLFKETCTFCVVYRCRNNSSFKRDEVIPAINSIVKRSNPENTIDYDSPDLVILIEVVCNICCIGAAHDFFGLRKYNLIEAIKGVNDRTKKPNEKETDICDVNVESNSEVTEEVHAPENNATVNSKVKETDLSDVDVKVNILEERQEIIKHETNTESVGQVHVQQ